MTANSDRLSDTFANIARKLQADFDISRGIEHRGSKGTAREGAIKDFLSDFVPRVAAVTGNAELISTDGQVSGQCDLLVVDASTPPLWSSDSVQSVPIESCHAWIEVKSNLTVKELTTAWDAAVKIKQMPRRAYVPGVAGALFGSQDPFGVIKELHREMRPQCHVFAYSGASLERLQEALVQLAARVEPGLGLDFVAVLDQGVLNRIDLPGGRPSMDAIAAAECEPGQVLLFLNTLLHKRLARVEMYPRLDFNQYVTELIDLFEGSALPILRGGP